jgi:DNA-directed RNA polymerase specialized sigma subunit
MLLGATDEEIAEALQVDVRTLYEWQRARPDFAQVLKTRKEGPDERVVRSLYLRAVGYTYTERVTITEEGKPTKTVATEHRMPPSEVACIFWLKNRQRENWRDRQEVDVMGEIKVIEEPSDREVAKALALLLEQRKRKTIEVLPEKTEDGKDVV